MGRLALSCPYGDIGEILDYGMNKEMQNKYVCQNNAANEACKPDAAFVTNQLDSSIGKDKGYFDFGGRSLYNSDSQERACTLTTDPITGQSTNDATLFVQYTCI